MQKGENNYAFIDSQNLYKGIKAQGWHLDYKKFRIYLREKYGVSKAYFFIGFIPKYKKIYEDMEHVGYEIIFKPVVRDGDTVKGNVDAELVLQAMHEYQNYDKVVIVSGDGDFYCLVKYLHERNKLARVIIPDKYKYSVLLRRSLPRSVGFTFLNDLKKRFSMQAGE
jgi:uncharacterized LabA/DUF88 family protein